MQLKQFVVIVVINGLEIGKTWILLRLSYLNRQASFQTQQGYSLISNGVSGINSLDNCNITNNKILFNCFVLEFINKTKQIEINQ